MIQSHCSGEPQVADVPERFGGCAFSAHPSDGAHNGRLDPQERFRLPLEKWTTLANANECPAPETVFFHHRRNPTSAHLQPTWLPAV
jgi:hypothetical protein